MPTKSIAPFIASSRKYVAAAVAKANANKNTYLTKAEAKKLPKDLQDNFANFRALGKNSGSVVAEEFVKRYGDYVEAVVRKADKNESGVLSSAEISTLPDDVRDNFTNFWANGGGDVAPAAELQTAAQRADSIYNRALPASSALGKLAKELDQQLADGNIMSGVVGTASGKLPNAGTATDAQLSAWGTALMTDYLAVSDDGAKALDVKVEHLSASAALQRAGLILADGNAFDTSNPENVKGLLDGEGKPGDDDHVIGLKEVNAKLGTPVKALVVSGKRKNDDGDLDKVGLALFLNTKTGEFVGYYGREGHT